MYRVRGFTLIEMVVALTILALVVMATLTGMRTLALTQSRVEARAEETARLRAVTDFLRRTISQAKPAEMYKFGRSEGHFFYGNGKELVWAAPLPIPGVSGGLFALRLSLNEKNELVLQVREGVNTFYWGDETSYRLTDNVELLRVEYRQNRGLPWVSEWVRQVHEDPPSHVKIALKVAGRYWPEIIISVRGW